IHDCGRHAEVCAHCWYGAVTANDLAISIAAIRRHFRCCYFRRYFDRPKAKPPSTVVLGGFKGEPGDYLLSHGYPHYHRRGVVSRSCSGWEGVVPTRYGHQA